MNTKKAPEQFRFAALAVDVIVLGFMDGELYGLVGTVDRPPYYNNVPGFLGGMVTATETAEDTVARVLREKGNLGTRDIYLEQLATFSAIDRDRRNRVVSVAYLGLVRPDSMRQYTHAGVSFRPLRECARLAYDHDAMLAVAQKRLSGKLTYTTIAQFLLPRHFTLRELQDVYERITGTVHDKRNFRKKIMALNIIEDTGLLQDGVPNRPAALFRFISTKLKELPLMV
jgi:8-oxo-dGTP diphosphatase